MAYEVGRYYRVRGWPHRLTSIYQNSLLEFDNIATGVPVMSNLELMSEDDILAHCKQVVSVNSTERVREISGSSDSYLSAMYEDALLAMTTQSM